MSATTAAREVDCQVTLARRNVPFDDEPQATQPNWADFSPRRYLTRAVDPPRT